MRPDDVLDVGEVAALLKITRGQVYKLANRGDLPHVRIGRTSASGAARSNAGSSTGRGHEPRPARRPREVRE